MIPASKLPQQQFAALLLSPGPARFKHFISRAADTELVWSLRDENGWVSLADEAGARGFPVWPHPDYALACATDAWAGNIPAEISVHEFVEKWLPNLAEHGASVAVFPTPSMKGTWTKPDDLQRYLVDELGRCD